LRVYVIMNDQHVSLQLGWCVSDEMNRNDGESKNLDISNIWEAEHAIHGRERASATRADALLATPAVY